MTTRFAPVATIHAPFGITNPLLPTLTWRGIPNGDSEAPGGPGGQAETGSMSERRSSRYALDLDASRRLAAHKIKRSQAKSNRSNLPLRDRRIPAGPRK